MRALVIAFLLVGCSQSDSDKLASAQHKAEQAQAAAKKAEAEAESAQKELESALADEKKAVDENEAAKQELAALHDEAAKTIADAHKKLDQLGALAKDLDAKIAQAKLAKDVGLPVLEQKRREVGDEIDQLAKMTKELESSLPK